MKGRTKSVRNFLLCQSVHKMDVKWSALPQACLPLNNTHRHTCNKGRLDVRSTLDCFQWIFSACAILCYMKRSLLLLIFFSYAFCASFYNNLQKLYLIILQIYVLNILCIICSNVIDLHWSTAMFFRTIMYKDRVQNVAVWLSSSLVLYPFLVST
jgi:hypothetical protein